MLVALPGMVKMKMREQQMFQVDAFTDRVFQGNPAGVIVTSKGLPADLMQSIAAENNLAETAFVSGYQTGSMSIRWFTPTVEVDLCGHATLAAAHVLRTEYQVQSKLTFQSRSGLLHVLYEDQMLWLDFPADVISQCDHTLAAKVESAIQSRPIELYRGKSDLMAVLESQEQVQGICPNLDDVAALDCRGLIVTAKGMDADFVSRFFAPQVGVPEDPVTGSAHTTLIPFWSEKLGKSNLFAKQISERGGELRGSLEKDRVKIGGHAVTYLRGSIMI